MMIFDGDSMLLTSRKHGNVITTIGYVKYVYSDDEEDILTDEVVIIKHVDTNEEVAIYMGDFYDGDFRIFNSFDEYVNNLKRNDDITILEHGTYY